MSTVMNKGETLKEILKVTLGNEEEMKFDINAKPIELLGIAMQLISTLAEETGVEYNDLLEDLKEQTNG